MVTSYLTMESSRLCYGLDYYLSGLLKMQYSCCQAFILHGLNNKDRSLMDIPWKKREISTWAFNSYCWLIISLMFCFIATRFHVTDMSCSFFRAFFIFSTTATWWISSWLFLYTLRRLCSCGCNKTHARVVLGTDISGRCYGLKDRQNSCAINNIKLYNLDGLY